MTTTQTIDGVPRELLARLLIAVAQDFATIGEVRELRALLDGPANKCGECGAETVQGCNACLDEVNRRNGIEP